MKRRKIVVFTGNRAEYGLLHPVIKKLSQEPSFDISLIISGSHLIKKFGETINEIDTSLVPDIIKIDSSVTETDLKAQVLNAYAKIINKATDVLSSLKPDILLLVGDRYETFAMAVTAYYLNIAIAHLFGGDLSQGGHLDDSVRHSVTKLAHIHFTTNEDSYRRVLRLGEEASRVFNVGSPAIDNVLSGEYIGKDQIEKEFSLDFSQPVIVFTQHPLTTETGLSYEQAKQSLEALKELKFQTVITYPCNDAGSQDIIKAINEYSNITYFRIKQSLGWKYYFGFLKAKAIVVGNSSSGIMETPIFKVPCVNIGSRQAGRFRAENVIDVKYEKEAIKKAVIRALKDNNFLDKVKNCSNPYGEGGASEKIVNILKSLPLGCSLLQKKMTY